MPVVATKTATRISIGIRGAQILFALLMVILASVSITKLNKTKYTSNPVAYSTISLVCGCWGVIYYVAMLTPAVVIFNPIVVLVFESLLLVFWLFTVAGIGNTYGHLVCPAQKNLEKTFFVFSQKDHFDNITSACKIGKGMIGVGLTACFLSIFLLVLVSCYLVVPAAKVNAIGEPKWVSVGGIFPKYAKNTTVPKAERTRSYNITGLFIAIRSVQILLSLLILALAAVNILSAKSLDQYGPTFVYPSVGVACGSLGVIYYVPLVTPIVGILNPISVLIFECVLLFFWLFTVGCAGYIYGPLTCALNTVYYVVYDKGYSYWYESEDYYVKTACTTGKGIIWVGVIGFLFSVNLLVLVIVYSIAPAVKVNAVGARKWFALGGISSKYNIAELIRLEAVGTGPHCKVVTWISVAIRSTQILISLSIVVLASISIFKLKHIHFGESSVAYSVLGLACGALGVLYYVPIMTPAVSIFNPIMVIIFESMLLVFWLIALGFLSNFYGPLVCFPLFLGESHPELQSYSLACKIGKGISGVSGLGMFLSFALLILVIIFSAVPAVQKSASGSRKWFSLGAIFPQHYISGLDDHEVDGQHTYEMQPIY